MGSKIFNLDKKSKVIDNYDNKNNINPTHLKFFENLVTDSCAHISQDNTFIVFKSINNILCLLYIYENNSIVSYDIINNKKLNEIKKPHPLINFFKILFK